FNIQKQFIDSTAFSEDDDDFNFALISNKRINAGNINISSVTISGIVDTGFDYDHYLSEDYVLSNDYDKISELSNYLSTGFYNYAFISKEALDVNTKSYPNSIIAKNYYYSNFDLFTTPEEDHSIGSLTYVKQSDLFPSQLVSFNDNAELKSDEIIPSIVALIESNRFKDVLEVKENYQYDYFVGRTLKFYDTNDTYVEFDTYTTLNQWLTTGNNAEVFKNRILEKSN